jgi:hypothetical protein
MPQLGNIVINDAAATPVAHTFAPVTSNGRLAELANRTATTPKGFETLRVECRKPEGQSTVYRVTAGLNDPVEAVVDGQTVVVRNSSFEGKFNFSPESTAQERKDLVALVSNLFAHATFKSTCENLEPIY